MALPTFPTDFSLENYKKELADNHPKMQAKLLQDEIEKIYGLVKSYTSSFSIDPKTRRHNAIAIKCVKFWIANGLDLDHRKHLLSELIKRFPVKTIDERRVEEITDEIAQGECFYIMLNSAAS